jgi:hypothetical protein
MLGNEALDKALEIYDNARADANERNNCSFRHIDN